ncbi:MAG: polymer-forming cytoskeletal protein [Eubacteriaceae bacterium]|nr:polymer-forming cytoskeletal protein [Eubacteriaceae bacterium]
MKREKPTLASLAHVETIISEDVVIIGEITEGGSIRLEGTVKGNVNILGNLIVGKNAFIQGDIVCDNINIIGKVEGNVRCKNLKIFTGASLIGSADIATIVIEENCIFVGNCTRREEAPGEIKKIDDILNISDK